MCNAGIAGDKFMEAFSRGLNLDCKNTKRFLHRTAKSHTYSIHLAPSWMIEIGLVWFGLYICPTKPKPVYRGLGKRK